ncbi:FxLYD domain-containing protein [Halocatena halophila]|uniref:FxLYD domain-containing protein n=1 Tax=Halocatena halophila TaxID=2814576 RepID=UPI002ED1C007
MDRRQFLRVSVPVGLSVSLSGCLGSMESSFASVWDNFRSFSTDESTDDASYDSDEALEYTAQPDSITSTPVATDQQTPHPANQLELLEHNFFTNDYSAGVRGTIVNNADTMIDYAEIKIHYRDADDELIGDGMANTTDLGAGEEWLFKTLFNGDDPAAVDSYDVKINAERI